MGWWKFVLSWNNLYFRSASDSEAGSVSSSSISGEMSAASLKKNNQPRPMYSESQSKIFCKILMSEGHGHA